MNFRVVVPSYNRHRLINEDTISTLLRSNIKPEQIDIWVTSPEEKVKYEEFIPEENYNEIIAGVRGKAKQINLYRRYYSTKERLLNIDDDIMNIQFVFNNRLEDINDLYAYSKFIFKMMNKYRTGLGGVYYPENPLFMNNSINFNFYNIIGGLYWTINNPSSKLDIFEPYCEDLEFSIKNYFMYKRLLRTNEVCVKDRSRYVKGTKRLANEKELSNIHFKFIQKYPKLLKPYKSGDAMMSKAIKQPNHVRINLKERRL